MSEYDVTLPEKGIEEMKALIESFKESAMDSLKKALSDVYTEIGPHIETDSWMNYREQLRMALADGRAWAETDNYWAERVRTRIFTEHKTELVKLINFDLHKKIVELERQIEQMQKWRSYP